MKLKVSKHDVPTPLHVLRKAGYSHFIDPNTQKESFILRLTPDRYPRMHLYVKEEGDSFVFDLHLDQKQASYKGSNMHGGEYDGPTVEREMARIEKWVQAVSGKRSTLAQNTPMQPKMDGGPKSKSVEKKEPGDLFGGLFG